jgi:hypothetical protein
MVLVDLQPRRLGWGSPYIGSVAVTEYIPKAAVRAAGIGGIADLAIHRERPFVKGKFSETSRLLEWRLLAVSLLLVCNTRD